MNNYRIQNPTIQAPCENHSDAPAQFVLGGHKVCNFCAELTLTVAEIGASPVQLPLVEALREEMAK